MKLMTQYSGCGEKNELLWQCPTQLGKLGVHSHNLLFPHRRNHRQRWSLLALSYATLGEEWYRGSKCSSYPLQWVQTHIFLFQWCADISQMETWTSTKVLLFVHDSRAVFSRGSWTATKRGWSQFTGYYRVCSQNQGPYAYYLMQRWARFDPYDAGSNSSHKGTLVHGWMPNCCCWERNTCKECLSYSAIRLTPLLQRAQPCIF